MSKVISFSQYTLYKYSDKFPKVYTIWVQWYVSNSMHSTSKVISFPQYTLYEYSDTFPTVYTLQVKW